MPVSVEFRGYPSQSQYVVAQWALGKTLKQIHEESGIRYATVVRAVSIAQGHKQDALAKAAAKRGITVAALKKKLLSVINKDNMVDAILDDLDEIPEVVRLPKQPPWRVRISR